MVIIGWLILAAFCRSHAQERLVAVDTLSKDTTGGVRPITLPVRATCKATRVSWFQVVRKLPVLRGTRPIKEPPSRPPMLTVHGNILYDFDYW